MDHDSTVDFSPVLTEESARGCAHIVTTLFSGNCGKDFLALGFSASSQVYSHPSDLLYHLLNAVALSLRLHNSLCKMFTSPVQILN